jgi:hypothetical protein
MKMDEQSFGKETSDSGSGASWIKLEKGDNKIRIVSEIFMAMKHRVAGSDGGFKQIVCPSAMNMESCPICDRAEEWEKEHKGDKEPNPFGVSKVFMAAVIDRKDGSLKILEKGKGVFGQLQGLVQSADYCPNGKIADLMMFDINIKRTGAGLDTRYQILPLPKAKPLTTDEAEKVEKEMRNFNALTMPKTASEIRKLLGMEEDGGVSPSQVEAEFGKGN